MIFKEEFPSLSKHLVNSDHGVVAHAVNIHKCCLDKQRVKEVIEKIDGNGSNEYWSIKLLKELGL